jgi:NADH-quinone oxidoreductase subunit J
MFDNLSNLDLTGENVAFILFAILIISGAVLMISHTKVVHMVLSLAAVFLGLAGLYVMLQAEFVAFVQVLIYAGAVTILMVFGIMMTKREQEEAAESGRRGHHVFLLIGVLALFGILFFSIQRAVFPGGRFDPGEDNTLLIGQRLFTEYVIPFELLSVLLTVAFIGAIILAKREDD